MCVWGGGGGASKEQLKSTLASRVNSSRFTRILTGSVINLLVISRISFGRVAEISTTCKAIYIYICQTFIYLSRDGVRN